MRIGEAEAGVADEGRALRVLEGQEHLPPKGRVILRPVEDDRVGRNAPSAESDLPAPDARTLLPLLREPSLRADAEVSLRRPAEDRVRSDFPLDPLDPDPGRHDRLHLRSELDGFLRREGPVPAA